MLTECYLIVSESGRVRASKNPPRLNRDEVKIKVEIELPDAIFEQPQLQASIVIPDNAIPQSPLNAQVADNVKEAVQAATGLSFAITVQEQKEDAES